MYVYKILYVLYIKYILFLFIKLFSYPFTYLER
jgi:hypothetical protein